MVYFGLAILLSVLYVLLIIYVLHGWKHVKNSFVADSTALNISIIIPIKNEAKNIEACIESIIQNIHFTGQYEIIVVDDQSTDSTLEVLSAIKNPHLKVLSLITEKGKKNALTYGINNAKFDTIVALDGDCIVPNQWLALIASSFFNEGADVVVGSVKIIKVDNTISRYERYDTAAMMAVTANGIYHKNYFLANGANLAFKKEVFINVNGFEGNGDIASGDDVFFVNKAAQAKFKIDYLKSDNASVLTYAQPNFAELLQQRKRWATKTKAYANATIVSIQALVFSVNLFIVLAIIIGAIFCHCLLFSGLMAFALKFITDYFFLGTMARYFHFSHALRGFIPGFLLYFVMILYMGGQALWPTQYKWKGEWIKK